MQSRQKGLLAKTIVISCVCVCASVSVCVWQAFVVPVFVFELSTATTKALTMATNYKSVGN